MSLVRPIAVYDANVLYAAWLRDLLLRLGQHGLVAPRWTDAIQDEWSYSLLKRRPELGEQNVQRTRAMMENAFADARVVGYEWRIRSLHLPDPNDRHVLAAAIEAGADVIVTFNLADFPSEVLRRFGIRAAHPDEFLMELLEQDRDAFCHAAAQQRASLSKPPISLEAFLKAFENGGMVRTAARLRELAAAL